MYSLDSFFDIYHFVVTLIVYFYIIINLVLLKGKDQIIMAVAIAIYFIIIYSIPDFLLSSTLVMLLFISTGVDFIVDKKFLLGMGIIVLLLPRDNPVYLLFAFSFYVITLTTFTYNSLRLLKNGSTP